MTAPGAKTHGPPEPIVVSDREALVWRARWRGVLKAAAWSVPLNAGIVAYCLCRGLTSGLESLVGYGVMANAYLVLILSESSVRQAHLATLSPEHREVVQASIL